VLTNLSASVPSANISDTIGTGEVKVYGINNLGQVVGDRSAVKIVTASVLDPDCDGNPNVEEFSFPIGVSRAFRWAAGVTTDLDGLGPLQSPFGGGCEVSCASNNSESAHATTRDINNFGQVAGWSFVSACDFPSVRATLWVNGVPTDLGPGLNRTT
jgi:uncharacterized membrane protein